MTPEQQALVEKAAETLWNIWCKSQLSHESYRQFTWQHAKIIAGSDGDVKAFVDSAYEEALAALRIALEAAAGKLDGDMDSEMRAYAKYFQASIRALIPEERK